MNLSLGKIFKGLLCVLVLLFSAKAGAAEDVLQGNSQTLSGRPTLVFEAGGGDGPETWAPLLPFTKDWGALFVYKRAGYGGSAQGTFPRTGRQVALELHQHLSQIGLKPPYVLIGHSVGGLYVQVFQRMFPKEVKGMVLIDPYKDFSTPCLEMREAFFRKTGTYPCSKELCLPPQGVPQPFQSEFENLGETLRELSELPPPRTIPIIYLSANQPMPDGLDPVFWAELMKGLQGMAKDIATQINATFREVDSGHYIHKEHPDVVAAAIEEAM